MYNVEGTGGGKGKSIKCLQILDYRLFNNTATDERKKQV